MRKPPFSRTARGSPPADPEPPAAARWHPAPRSLSLATVALLGLAAAVLTGHVALVLLAAPALGALALMSRRPPAAGPSVDVALSGSRCFEGEHVAITAAVRAQPSLDEIVIQLRPAPRVALVEGSARTQTFLRAGRASARWMVRPDRWGRYLPGAVKVTCCHDGWEMSLSVGADPLDVFPRSARMRPRLVPTELLRRIGEHTGRAVGEGVEFAGIRPYLPGDHLRDVNRAVSIRRGQLHVNQRSAPRAADLVVMIDAFVGSGPAAERALDLAVHGAAAVVTAYLRVSDRAGLVVLGGTLRWLGPGTGDRQFYRIAEMMLAARYDSFVAPDVGRIPRTALPPGTLVVVFSPLLDPRGFAAVTDLRQRGFPLIVVDTLRDEPPAVPRPPGAVKAVPRPSGALSAVSRASGSRRAALALRLWRLDRAATRSALRSLGVPVLTWETGTELDSVLAPLRTPPAALSRPAARGAR